MATQLISGNGGLENQITMRAILNLLKESALAAALILGLTFCQIVPFFGEIGSEVSHGAHFMTMIVLSFIMIYVGYEFVLGNKDAFGDEKSKRRQLRKDYLVGMGAAGAPWLLVCFYVMFLVIPEASTNWNEWKLNLLCTRFAAPTSAGVLFASIGGMQLPTFLFNKIRLIAICDDADTSLSAPPLQILIIGFAWQLGVVVFVVVATLIAAWKFYRRVAIPFTIKNVSIIAIAIVGISEGIRVLAAHFGSEIPLHIEVLLPSFAAGCMLKQDPNKHNAEVPKFVVTTFMFLVGFSMPPFLGNALVSGVNPLNLSWQETSIHVLAITFLSLLGKMVPTVCYREDDQGKPLSWKHRLGMGVCMWPRGEVGAGILLLSQQYGVNQDVLMICTLTLVLNLVLTPLFIKLVKYLWSEQELDVHHKTEFHQVIKVSNETPVSLNNHKNNENIFDSSFVHTSHFYIRKRSHSMSESLLIRQLSHVFEERRSNSPSDSYHLPDDIRFLNQLTLLQEEYGAGFEKEKFYVCASECYYADEMPNDADLHDLYAYTEIHANSRFNACDFTQLAFIFNLGIGRGHDNPKELASSTAMWTLNAAIVRHEEWLKRQLEVLNIKELSSFEYGSISHVQDVLLGNPDEQVISAFLSAHPKAKERDVRARHKNWHQIESWLYPERSWPNSYNSSVYPIRKFLFRALADQPRHAKDFEKGLMFPLLRVGNAKLRVVPTLQCCNCNNYIQQFSFCESCGGDHPKFKKAFRVIIEDDERFVETVVFKCAGFECGNFRQESSDPRCLNCVRSANSRRSKYREKATRIFRFDPTRVAVWSGLNQADEFTGENK